MEELLTVDTGFESPEEPPGRVTFSFDSSGWLYVYHLGVAHCLQQQLLGRGSERRADFAFSGSSGGALVAAALATDIDVKELAAFVIDRQAECQYNPWNMFPATELALDNFLGQAAHKQANGRLRVLLTRIQLFSMKPVVRPETISKFASLQHLKQVLRASCHIPFIAGGLPYHVERQQAADGSVTHSGGNYIDGLYWPSVLFQWRAFDRADTLVKVSGLGNPTAAIRPPLVMPLHWLILPPKPPVLWKFFACGYHDAARWLAEHGDDGTDGDFSDASAVGGTAPPRRNRKHSAAQLWHLAAKLRSNRSGGASGSAAEVDPPPLAPGEMTRILLGGWAELVLLTLLFPLVVPFIAGMETRRRWHEHDDRPLRYVIAYRLLHSAEAAAFFALWPVLLTASFVRWAFVGGAVRPRRKHHTYVSSRFASAFASLSAASRSAVDAGTPENSSKSPRFAEGTPDKTWAGEGTPGKTWGGRRRSERLEQMTERETGKEL